MTRPRILVSNDDGYGADGIRALADAMREVGDVCVSAPARNCSGASSSLSINREIKVEQFAADAHVVHGTPTDSVHLALTVSGILPWPKPDLTVSGINCGSNLGDDTIYSGTVAAALESVLLGVPAIAFSLVPAPGEFPPQRFADAAEAARDFVLMTMEHASLPEGMLLNVNIPDIERKKMGAFVATRLGRRHPARNPVCRASGSEDNHRFYTYTMPDQNPQTPAGTDFWALDRNMIAVTPLVSDLTHARHLDETVAGWLQ